MQVHLLLFGSEEDEVPHVEHRLPGDHFFVAAKMPVARTRYEHWLSVETLYIVCCESF